MPEYLAPGVYVEEIDTGSKPIEGVSTSTAGMVGVAERGPVNVPILITGVAEYQRWFGGHLRADDFPDEDRTRPRRFLPHAVEGFFTNGGKRVYVVRVLDIAQALPARAVLFDRGAAAAVDTRLLGRAAAGTAIYVAANAGLAVGTWLQVGEGGDAEFGQIQALPAVATDVTLRLPLAFAHRQGTTVEHFAPFAATPGTVALDDPVAPGARQIRVSGAGAIAAGTILRLGAAGTDEEYLVVRSVDVAAPAPRTVTLRTPVLLAHPAGANAVALMPALAAAAHTTTLTAAVAAGESALLLADRTGFTTGDIAPSCSATSK